MHSIVKAATGLFRFVQANPLSSHAERQQELYRLMAENGLTTEDERDGVLFGCVEMQMNCGPEYVN